MIKAIIYDLDDTLYPEREFQLSGFRAVANSINKRWHIKVKMQEISRIYRKYPKQTFDQLIKKYELALKPEALVKVYREHIPVKIKLHKGVSKVLAKLSQNQYFLGMITGNPYKSQVHKLKSLGLEKYFDYVVYTDLLKAPKPANLAFQIMKKKAGCNDKEIIYIGDNERIDFLGAKKNGYLTIKYVGKGFYSHLKMPHKYRADFQIKNHEEVLKILGKLNRHS